jgi:hypothetical protein
MWHQMTEKPKHNELQYLFTYMGICLVNWQKVEDEHYLLFRKWIGFPKDEISAVLYYSPPTFESRRVLVDRIAQCVLDGEEDMHHLKSWKKLNKQLESAAKKRGRIAHYSLDFEITYPASGPLKVEVGAPRLAPTAYNKLKTMQGKGADNPSHRLSIKELAGYITSFDALEKDLSAFRSEAPQPKRHYGAGLLQDLVHLTPLIAGPLPTTPRKNPSDGTPS